MQNSENIDTSNFSQYQNLASPRYTNYATKNQYKQSIFKIYKGRFSSGGVYTNSNGYYFLTEKNNNNYEPLINDLTLYNSNKYYKEYKYPSGTKNNIDSLNIGCNTQRNTRIEKSYFINNLSNNNIHEVKNGFNDNNKTKKNYSKIIFKMNTNQNNKVQYNIPIKSTYKDIKNINDNNNKQLLIKINKNTYNLIHNKSKSNILNDVYLNNINKNNLQPYTNEKKFSMNNHNQTYNDNYTINLINQRNNNNIYNLKHKKVMLNTDINDYKLDNLTFNKNIKKEIKSQKSSLNISNKNDKNKNNSIGKKKNIEIKMINTKKYKNIILSPRFENSNSIIKKFSLVNNSNLNDRNINDNHSFYERKSFSKDIYQEKNPQIHEKKKQIISKNNQGNKHLTKYNSNNYIIKFNTEKHQNNKTIKKIYSSKVISNNNKEYNKEEKNKYKLKLIKNNSKTFLKNINNNDVSLKEIQSIKENINTNNVNIFQNTNNNSYKYPKIIENRLNTDKNNKNIYKKISQSTKASKENNFNGEEKIKKISINKSKSNIFSFIQKPNLYMRKTKQEIKKIKKVFSKKNIIQLNNISNKVYEEDFIVKVKKDKILKPQISVRLTLFSNNNEANENYFLVNLFYSENIKNKLDYEESDF